MSVVIQNPRQFDWKSFDINLFDKFAYQNKTELKHGRPSIDYVKQELAKCQASFSYFCRNYVNIFHPTKGFVLLELRPYQHRIATQYESNRFSIMRKSRQMGCSTITAIWLLWKALMSSEPLNIVILSIGNRESMDFLKHIRNAYKRLPKWLAGKSVKENDHEIVFDNNSSIRSLPSPKQAGRGIAASILVLDECAFIQNIAALWTASYMTIATGGKAIALSTVNGTHGTGGWFFDMWSDAIEGNNDFFPIDLDYWEFEEYANDSWVETTKRNIGEKRFRQEVLKEFTGSIDTFFPNSVIVKLLDPDKTGKTTIKDPIERLENDMMWIWEHPQPDEVYILGGDVAKQGTGKSNSTFQIIKCSTMEQVAEFQGRKNELKISTIDFAKVIDKYGKLYNGALAAVELENMGLAVINELFVHLNYHNMFFHKENVPGWSTSTKTRPLIITKLYEVFEKEQFILHSIRTLREMQTFAEDAETGKIQKQKNSTDDLLIALGIALNCIEAAIASKPLLLMTSRNYNSLTGRVDKNSFQESIEARKELLNSNKTISKEDPWKMNVKLPFGQDEQMDISWLIDKR